MKIRFVQGSDFVSQLIIAHAKTAMPFTPSHIDAITPAGLYLGARYEGGVQEREPGYDREWLKFELILDLEATPEQNDKFYNHLYSKIGLPYDWNAIHGFMIPGHHHDRDHVICSALITLALRGSEWFQWPLCAPAHLISPRDLLVMLSCRMHVPL